MICQPTRDLIEGRLWFYRASVLLGLLERRAEDASSAQLKCSHDAFGQALSLAAARRSRWGCWSGALRTPARTPAAGGARPPWTPTLPGRACTTPRTLRPSKRRSPAAKAAEPLSKQVAC